MAGSLPARHAAPASAEEVDDPLGEQLLGVDAAGSRGPLAVLDLKVVAAEEAVELADVADLRPARIGALDAQRVGDHAHHQAPDLVRLGEDRDRVAGALPHLPHAVDADHHRGVGEDGLRLGKNGAVAPVEGPDHLPGELEMGRLVLADRDSAGLVDDDVGRLQNRVVEQAEAVLFAVFADFLVGRVALCPGNRHTGLEDPCKLAVLRQIRLTDQGAPFGVESDGQQVEDHLVCEPAQLGAVVDGGERMQIHDAVDGVVLILERDVVDLGTQVVPEVGCA